ncbi:MAG: hypothetical protein ABL967_09920 [Bryobacteraceae bacterium]
MPPQHFMREDLLGVTLGTLLFALVLLSPGYLLGWLLDLLNFRRLHWLEQLGAGLTLSVAITPILIFHLWTTISITAVWAFYAVCGISFVYLFSRRIQFEVPGFLLGACGVWLLVAVLSGIDLQWGSRLFPSILTYDFSVRTAMIAEISRDGLPAQNPFFYPGHAVLLRYHYFWLILCSLIDLLGQGWVSARQALIAGNVWCGWALMSTVVLYCRYFHPFAGRSYRQSAKWAIAILAIAGLDILPNTIFNASQIIAHTGIVYPSSEWWNEPVTGLVHAVLWVAHYVLGLIACFTAFLLLWIGAREKTAQAILHALCAGLCLASAAGLAIYMVFTFAIFLVIWGGRILIRGGGVQRMMWPVTGIVAAIAVLPYLRILQAAGGAGGTFATFGVRRLLLFHLLLDSLGYSPAQIQLGDLLMLPLNYFLETGIWFTLALIWGARVYRRRNRVSEAELAAISMFGISVFVGTFLRSGVIANNDLGWRSMLFAQLILAIWSVTPLRAWWRLRARSHHRAAAFRRFATVLVVLGALSTAYEVLILRFYVPLSALGAVRQFEWFGQDGEPGRRIYDARFVYQQLDRIAEPTSIVQSNPTTAISMFQGLYGAQRSAAADSSCGAAFGGEGDCRLMHDQLAALFNDPATAKGTEVDLVCERWKIDYLVSKDDDPVFANRSSWVWTRTPVASAERVRAIACGSLQNQVR